jgi:hypothetical protein
MEASPQESMVTQESKELGQVQVCCDTIEHMGLACIEADEYNSFSGVNAMSAAVLARGCEAYVADIIRESEDCNLTPELLSVVKVQRSIQNFQKGTNHELLQFKTAAKTSQDVRSKFKALLLHDEVLFCSDSDIQLATRMRKLASTNPLMKPDESRRQINK